MAKQSIQHDAEFCARQRALTNAISKKIVKRIEHELLECDMTHKDFAAYINHSQGVVSRWLNGKHNFTLSTLAMISLTLDIDLFE